MEKRSIFTEEKGLYCIDCTAAEWSSDNMHEVYRNTRYSLADIDWIIQDNDSYYLVEYKNANVPHAKDFSIEEKLDNFRKKFYDSMLFLNLIASNKPLKYILILETQHDDKVSRKRLTMKLLKKLPTDLERIRPCTEKLIKEVKILSIDEWNSDAEYGRFPIKSVTKIEKV